MGKKFSVILSICIGLILFSIVSIIMCSIQIPPPMESILIHCKYKYLDPFYVRHGFFSTNWDTLLSAHQSEDLFKYSLYNAGEIKKPLTPITFTLSGRTFYMSASYKTFLKTHTYECKITIEYGGLDYYCLSARNSEALEKRNRFEDHYMIMREDIEIPNYFIRDYVKSPRHFSTSHIIRGIFNPDILESRESPWRKIVVSGYKAGLIYVGFLKRKDEVDKVVNFLSDKSEENRCAAVWALGQLGLPEYASKLKENLKDTESLNIKLNTLLSLNLLGEDINPNDQLNLIEKGLSCEEPITRIYAIETLSTLKGQEHYKLETLSKLIRDDDIDIRLATIIALRKIPQPEVLKIIVEGLKFTDYETAHAAEITLGQLTIKGGDFDLIGSGEWLRWNNENERLKLYNSWKDWLEENGKYLYWSITRQNIFLIDEEAKSAGIPTEEYRKTHPWTKEEKK